MLSGRKILVTGASGFLGSHLTRRLCQSGAEVHAVSRTQRTTKGNGPSWWQADMADLGSAREVLATVKPHIVYHFAGLSTADPSFELVLPILRSLLVSTVNVLALAKELGGCRVVLAASLTEPESGDTHPTPTSPYAAAKWASSGYARMFHQLYRQPVVMVRPFMTYGPAQDPRKLVPYVILCLLRGESPKLSSGRQQFDWVYIDDVIEGLLAAAVVRDVEGCTIDLGSGTLVPMRMIVDQLVTLTGAQIKPAFGALPDRPFEQSRVANTIDAHARLSWQPKTSLHDGLKQTVDWYRHRLHALSAGTSTILVSD
jgi:UDP-glucose 4-epimerase